ncbi:aspartate/glutamate racemase family protein [Ferrovibrio terrae]|uniref:maleate cis-trans isomerase family protein n=1 Tax=Ferrovibrio terrae TaxID=2594003 RepID=UPI003137D5E1
MSTRLGMLTPSSNTALEPATYGLLRPLPNVSAHFARFPVTEIALSASALGQFDAAPILQAATLLSHAKVDAIAWNGTSASWLGFDRDVQLAATITAQTGIRATTAILAMNEILQRLKAQRLAFVTPYLSDVQAKIASNYQSAGYSCVAERHAGLQDNFSFATLPAAEIESMIMAVAADKPDAIAIICTNMDATRLAPLIEARTGIPVIDSISATLWGALDTLGITKQPLREMGVIFGY